MTLRRVAVLLLVATVGLGSGWILRGQETGALAVVYYWKAKPGKLDDYNRYIKAVAEPIDGDARKRGAFVSVTTYISRKADAPWTHMRVFIVKDREQASQLAKALDEAGVRVVPDEAKRKANQELSASLRDFVAEEELDILR